MSGFLKLCVILVLIFNDRAARCRVLDQNAPPDAQDHKLSKNSTSPTLSDSKNNASDILPPKVNDSAAANKTEEDSKEYPNGNDHCCGNKVLACLSSPGSDADHGVFSLEISSHHDVDVKITTPDFLTADKHEFTTTADGKKIVVRIEMADPEAAKVQPFSNITITYGEENCELPVPSQNLGYSQEHPAHGLGYSRLRSPVVGFSMLTLALILVLGIWAYFRYRGKNRHNVEEAKYVELEMGDSTATGAVDGAAAVAVDETNDEDGWDENWDEDWEDTEKASSSSSIRKGLAARRAAGKAD